MDNYMHAPLGETGTPREPPPRMPARSNDVPHDPELRKMSERARAVSDALDRKQKTAPPQTPRELIQVFDGGNIPTTPGKVFLANPVEIDADDTEGATPNFTTDGTQVVPVIVINQAAVSGDVLVAHAVAGRWVAEKTGSNSQSKSTCRWLCGPYVQIDPPTGYGFDCQAALASVTVASNGTIAGVTLLSGGSCYNVANPNAVVKVDGFPTVGSGATLLATVGEVVTMNVTDGGGGYDPDNPPTVTIAPPGGGGATATATATVDPVSLGVSNLTITSGGSLYQVANPTVTIAPPGGDWPTAKATAVAKPGQVTSLKLLTPGSGYVDNTPPTSLNLTITCPNWSVSFPLQVGNAPPEGVSPPGTLLYCGYGGNSTVNIPAGICPALSDVPISAWATYSDDNSGWVLAAFANVQWIAADTECGNPSEPGFSGFCLKITPSPSTYYTGGGPVGPMYLNCKTRPFSWSQTITSNMQGAPSQWTQTWWLMQGSQCGDPLNYTFTLSEP